MAICQTKSSSTVAGVNHKQTGLNKKNRHKQTGEFVVNWPLIALQFYLKDS